MDQGRNSTYKLLSQNAEQEMEKKKKNKITFVDSGIKVSLKLNIGRKFLTSIDDRNPNFFPHCRALINCIQSSN